jgi:hypothetical protein
MAASKPTFQDNLQNQWLRMRDSNPHKEILALNYGVEPYDSFIQQSLLCYRYTNPQWSRLLGIRRSENQSFLVFYSGEQSSTYGSIRSAVASLLILPCEVNLKTGIEPELPL